MSGRPAAGAGATAAPAPSARYAWMVVALLWGVALLNYLDRQMLSTMKPAMQGDIRDLESAANFGRLMAAFLWIYGLTSPIAGLVADRVSRKWLITASLVVWSAVTLGMGFARDFETLYLLRAIMGVSEALYIPAGLALIADYHPGPTRSLAVGIHMTGLYAGQALGGFGATIAQGISWQRTFQAFGLVGVLYGAVLAFGLREHPGARGPTGGPGRAGGAMGLRSVAESLSTLLGTVPFWAILFCFMAPSFPGWATKNWLPTLFSQSLGLDMPRAGPVATITIAASSFAGVVSGGLLADRWIARNLRGRIYTSAIGLGLTVPALGVMGLGAGAGAAIGGAILFGVGFGMFDANNMPILCQFVSRRHRAAGYGLLNMAGVFAGAQVTRLLGASTDAGRLGRDFAFLAVPVAIALVLQLAVLRPRTADRDED
ncbi:MAG TPA: MFS transporter [Vicinamibacterales bacterium]|nr:MFS transporter [Vicinamibacterales bacterium]HPW21859.1 MFS transporter [Vicinamibacterales bacterium]